MLFNRKFDLIISIGEDCACSSYLRRFNLQDYTYPFDWLTKASFDTRMNLLLNDFDSFLIKENIKYLEKPKNANVDSNCDYYQDVKNDIYFYHDFRINIPFNSEFENVKEKYNRRICRLYDNIANSKKVLFVWWSRNKHLNYETIAKYYQMFSKKFFNQDIYFLIIEYSEIKSEDNLLDNHVKIIKYDNISFKQNSNWNEVMGNEKNNEIIFSQIKKRRTLIWYINFLIYKFVKLLISLIFIKNVRRKLRTNWQYICFKAKL